MDIVFLRRVQRVAKLGGPVGIAVVCALFVLGPAQTLARVFSITPEKLSLSFPLLVIAIGLATVSFLMVEGLCFSALSGGDRPDFWKHNDQAKKTLSLWFIALLVLAWGWVVYQAGSAPYEWDEMIELDLLRSELGFDQRNPLILRNHFFANVLAKFLLETGGVSKLWLRSGSLFFTAVFLGAIAFAAKHFFFSFASRALLVAPFFANAFVGWFFFSFRGYGSLMASAMLLFAYHHRLMFAPTRRRGYAIGAALFVLPFFSHAFGLIFSLVLWLGTVTWYSANRYRLSSQEITRGLKLLLSYAVWFPVLLGVGLVLFSTATQPGQIREIVSDNTWLTTFSILFGFSKLWQARLLIAVLLAAIYFVWRDSKKLPFWVVVSALAFLLFEALREFRGVPIPPPRYLTPFLIPIIWGGAESAGVTSKPIPRAVWAIVLGVVFVFLPWLSRGAAMAPVLTHAPFQWFVQSAVSRLALESKRACVSLSGERSYIRLAESYLLKGVSTKNCDSSHHLHLVRDEPSLEFIPVPPEVVGSFHVLSESGGSLLFQRNP